MKWILILLFLNGFGQNLDIYNRIKDYKIDNIENDLPKVKEGCLKDLLNYNILYLKTGKLNNTHLSINKELSKEEIIIQHLLYGNILNDLENNDRLNHKIYEHYLSAYTLSKEINSIELQNDCLERMLNYIQYQPNHLQVFEKYKNEYLQRAESHSDLFWSNYYDLIFHYYSKKNTDYRITGKVTKKKETFLGSDKISQLITYAGDNPYFLGLIYQAIGVYYHVYQNDNSAALQYYNNSITNYNKSKLYYSKCKLYDIIINKSLISFDLNNYNEAIAGYRHIFFKNDISLSYKSDLTELLYLAYSKKNQLDSAQYFLNYKQYLNEKIKEEKQVELFHEIDTQYQSHEKDLVINSLKNNKILYLSLILVVFLLALYSFVRWKKVDLRKKRILNEKQQIETIYSHTIEELTKMKQLVIEDHVVLKNKVKIYLKELIYVKADDHYLELYTNKKKEFMRGKLSEILDDLPPNFVKCHRSYIINKNFVKQVGVRFVVMEDHTEIPISRNFRLDN